MKQKILATFLLLLFLLSCSNKNELWSDAVIDPSLKHDKIFTYLKKSPQKYIYKVRPEVISRRTAYIDNHHKKTNTYENDSTLFEYYQSKIRFVGKDTLNVKIGIDGGLGGNGISIKYKGGKFKIVPFIYTDQPNVKNNSEIKIIHQNLILDKVSYKINDSIYGIIDFEIHEKNLQGTTIHSGKMYFMNFISKN
ncbi:hypothetical protein [uncultured Chryseobacterium sp.]|uniref:hypothetical protein n=1 Tax=uncultured Chryseobacterium sp. TaxID=259322 RepID=UPI0025F4A00D|nr:hypothetical protein [uncultured Chryseobacterium sp.]